MQNLLKLYIVILFLTGLFSGTIQAQTTADKFVKASHTFQGTALPYRIFIPEGNDPGKKYPLVLALHGMGERGNDNNRQLTANKMATSWAEAAVQSKNPCYVIAPQCPATSGWADSPVQDVLFSLVEIALTKYNVDADRIYVTGLSMGGNGTWNSICQRPGLFAAAVPVAGWGNNTKAQVIKNIPIWAFHGQIDNTVSVDNSRFMVDAIVNQGIDAVYTNCYYVDTRSMPADKLNNALKARSSLIYTELYSYSHNVWDYAYNYNAMFDWVFSKRKFIKNAISLTTGVSDTTVYEPFSIKWNTEFVSDSVEIWFKSEQQEYWKLLKKESAGKKGFDWNTNAEKECIYGKLRICLTDSASRVYSQTESAWITIDQSGNCMPFVKLKTPDFIKTSNIISKRIDVMYIANDAESDSVTVVFNYSADGGKTFYIIDSVKVQADNIMKTKTIKFSQQLNTYNGILKLVVFDDERFFGSDSTISFTNQLRLDVTAASDFGLNNDYPVLQCYPNPANQVSYLILDLPGICDVSIFVYNNQGNLIFQKKEAGLNKGKNEIKIHTAQFSNGIYNYSIILDDLKTQDFIRITKVIIVQH